MQWISGGVIAAFTENPKIGKNFADALAFAVWAHRFQIRKQGEVPYISHLMAVSGLVLESGGSEDEAIAALLHDYMEDINPKGWQVLCSEFGQEVAIMVGNLSAETNKEYVARLRSPELAHRDSVLFISFFDKLHNLRSYASDGRGLWKPAHAEFYAQLIPLYEECDRIPSHFLQEMKDKLKFLIDWVSSN